MRPFIILLIAAAFPQLADAQLQQSNYNANYCGHVRAAAGTLGNAYFRLEIPIRSLWRRVMDLNGPDHDELLRSRGTRLPYPYDILAIAESDWLRTSLQVVPRALTTEIGENLEGRERADDAEGQIRQYQSFAQEWFQNCMARRADGRWR
ncbi:hypothetical protein [Pararhodobacter aggregans]|uniref:hypothetical protein n=1 Tax=Pararhodobacter aggregans TaxID=404875 RepID=UPI003A9231F5